MIFWKSLHAPRTIMRLPILAAACSLSLAGCVNQRIDQTNADQIIDRFTRGETHLSAGLAAAGNNVWYEDRYYEASVRGDWKALLKLVVESDDGNDTGYFYLGLAAEGFHYPAAARIYYQLSINASQTNNPPADCTPGVGYLSDRQCHGLSLPRDAYARLGALAGAATGSTTNTTASSSPPAPPSNEVARLLAIEDKLNDECRGGMGDETKTERVCDERDKVFDKLTSLGWCYGEPGQYEYQKHWQKCHQ